MNYTGRMNITEYRQGLHEKILVTAMSEFHKHGISAVKMDEIARILSISKRTLYEIYANKEENSKQQINYLMQENYSLWKDIYEKTYNIPLEYAAR